MYSPLIFKWLIRCELANTEHSKQMNSLHSLCCFLFQTACGSAFWSEPQLW